MVLHRRIPLLALACVALVHTSGVARADDPHGAPRPPRRYHAAPPPQPVYLAPLSQRTQTTYVPQSVALSGPAQLDAPDDSRRAPAGYTSVLRKRTGLVIAGAATLGGAYVSSALFAAMAEDEGSDQAGAAWLPVIGPFAQLAQTDSAFDKLHLLGLGVAQAAGALMLYYGLTREKRVFVRNDLVGNITIMPMAGQDSSGMVLSGAF